jgi:peptide/nickel transport system substrate-binding protein
LQLAYVPVDGWQHLELGIEPLTYDAGFNVFQQRGDYFGDVRMRHAIAMCIDREALMTKFGAGQGSVPGAYMPPAHPLTNAAPIAYDPAAANAMLDELGWIAGADGVRVNSFFPGAMQAVQLILTLHTSDDGTDLAVASALQTNLEDCGIGINIVSAPAEQSFAPGPGGEVFGRAFDLALFAWPFTEGSACYLYLSDAIPGPDLSVYRYGWGGWNISGWSEGDYDAACEAALISLPGEASYGDAERQAQAYFAEQLPAIPLYVAYEAVAAKADFCGFSAEAGSGLLQSIETYGYAEWCQ